jgi:two-component system, cell cycle response regulator CpdR
VTRVLLVEDDDGVRAALERALQPEFEVVSSSTGGDGLRRLSAGAFDVLLTDLGLPDMAGETLAVAARRLEPAIGVVIMSGDADRLETSRGLADAALGKPCPLEVTKATLRSAARQGGPSGSGGRGPLRSPESRTVPGAGAPAPRERRLRKRGKLTTAMAAVLLVAATGCGRGPTSASDPAPLQGQWTLLWLAKAAGPVTPPPAGATFSADFRADGGLSLRVDCNRCSGRYTSGTGELSVADAMACTRAYCPSAPYDTDYERLVVDAEQWTIGDGELELRSASGRLRFRAGALPR